MDEDFGESIDTSDVDVSDVDTSDDFSEDISDEDFSEDDINEDYSEDYDEADDSEYEDYDEFSEDGMDSEVDETGDEYDEVEDDVSEDDLPEDEDYGDESGEEFEDTDEEIPEDSAEYEETENESEVAEDIPEDVDSESYTDAEDESTDDAEDIEDASAYEDADTAEDAADDQYDAGAEADTADDMSDAAEDAAAYEDTDTAEDAAEDQYDAGAEADMTDEMGDATEDTSDYDTADTTEDSRFNQDQNLDTNPTQAALNPDTKESYSSLSDYMNAHNYGPDDFGTYSQDPEWRSLHKQAFPDYEMPPLNRADNVGKWDDIPADISAKANIDAANPNYYSGDEWKVNCQRCVPTYEMRSRGYDVTAQPCIDDNDDLSYNPFDVWEQPDIKTCTGNGMEDIQRQMAEWGDGARSQVVVLWDNGYGGHTFTAVQHNGSTHFVDPQNGDMDVSWYFNEASPGDTQFCRIDKLQPSNRILDCCSKRRAV